MRMLATVFLFGLVSFFSVHSKDKAMPQHATGSFTVDVKPLTPTPADGIARYSINKAIHGGLEGSTQGEMFSAGDPQHGHAGYVAIERVNGTVDGKHGSFVLQHFATMNADGPKMTVGIVPGSGTDSLTGITGTFDIKIVNGQHNYDLTYELPKS